MNRFLRATTAAAIALPMIGGIASASPVPFTWDPAQAVPSLPGSAFTADTMQTTLYMHSLGGPTGSFDRQFIIDINGFRLNGQPVVAPGFDSAYSLYFTMNATGQGTTFHTLNIALMADPTNDDGTPSATITGVSFSNPAGVADDFVLGTGTLYSATLTPNPITGLPDSHLVQIFSPAPGQEDFFGSIPTFLEEFHSTPLSAFQFIPHPGGGAIVLVNGAIGRANFIPEPGSLVLLASSLLGLGLLLRPKMSRLG